MPRYLTPILISLIIFTGKLHAQPSYENIIAEGRELRNNSEYEQSIETLQKGLDLAKAKGEKRNQAEFEIHIGISYWYAGDLSQAYQCFESILTYDSLSVFAADAMHNKALLLQTLGEQGDPKQLIRKAIKIYRSFNESSKLANALLNLGNRERSSAENVKALEHLVEAAELFKQSGDFESLAKAYDGIGAVHEYRHDYLTAKQYYWDSYNLFEELENKESQSNMFNNLGTVYKSLSMPDSSIYCFEQSIEIKKTYNFPTNLPATYHNLASTYRENQDYRKAEKFYLLALSLKRLDSTSSAYTFNELGRVEMLKGNYPKAQKYLDSCGLFNTENDPYVLLRNFENKADLFVAIGDFKSAHTARQLYAELYISLYNNYQTSTIQELQRSFEAEDKRKQITELKQKGELLSLDNFKKTELISVQSEQIEWRNTLLLIFGIALVLILILIFAIYQSIKLKHSRENLRIQQQIKQEIGADLHEIVVSNLHGIRLMIESLSGDPDVSLQKGEKISKNVQDVSAQIHFISHRLSPISEKLKQSNFTDLLENDFSEFEDYSSIQIIREEIPDQLNFLSIIQANNLYAIIREALNNTLKHSNADQITIRFHFTRRNLTCIIFDNGNGFTDKESNGIGIQSIKLRTTSLKGKVTIEPDNAKISIIFPHKIKML